MTEKKNSILLAIESSCDDTSAAVMRDGILHIFSDAVRDAAGTAAAQNKEQEREDQHLLFHRNTPLSKILRNR